VVVVHVLAVALVAVADNAVAVANVPVVGLGLLGAIVLAVGLVVAIAPLVVVRQVVLAVLPLLVGTDLLVVRHSLVGIVPLAVLPLLGVTDLLAVLPLLGAIDLLAVLPLLGAIDLLAVLPLLGAIDLLAVLPLLGAIDLLAVLPLLGAIDLLAVLPLLGAIDLLAVLPLLGAIDLLAVLPFAGGDRPAGRPAFAGGDRPAGRPAFAGGDRPARPAYGRPDGPRPSFGRPDGPRPGVSGGGRGDRPAYGGDRPGGAKRFGSGGASTGRFERSSSYAAIEPLPIDLETTRLIFGKNSVLDLLKSNPGRVSKILVADGLKPDKRLDSLHTLAKQHRIVVQHVPKAKLDRTLEQPLYSQAPTIEGETPDIERLNHQGVLALVTPKVYSTLEDTIERLRPRLDSANTSNYPLIMILDGITDPRNLGAILRVADGAGVDAIVLPKRNSAGLAGLSAGLVAKVASGAEDTVEIALVGNLSQAMGQLKEAGFWLFGTSDNQKSIGKLSPQTYDKAKYNMPVALLLGAEGDGLGKLVGERCDVLVTLPMRGTVNSLNVATAAAVLTYEIKRQHETLLPPLKTE
jgi:23S rRNA (guanosine2251-2'-O)-methyltransferase